MHNFDSTLKKFRKYLFVFFCLVVYTGSVCGVTINKHFCGGELESVSLLSKQSCCGTETEDEPGDCCENETIHVVNNGDGIFQSARPLIDPVSVSHFDVPVKVSFLVSSLDFNADPFSFPPGKPPLIRQPDLSFIMVFRI